MQAPENPALAPPAGAVRPSELVRDIVEQTRPRLLGIARRIAGQDLAEDVVQTAYLSLVRRAALPRPDLVTAWLVTATVRISFRQKAAARRAAGQRTVDAPRAPEREPGLVLMRREAADGLRMAIALLPAPYRDALVLRHLEGCSVAQTATLLGVPRQTAKTRLRRGRKLLRGGARRGLPARPFALVPLGVPRLDSTSWLIGGLMKAKELVLVGSLTLVAGATVMVMVMSGEGDEAPRTRSKDGRRPPEEIGAHPESQPRTRTAMLDAPAPAPMESAEMPRDAQAPTGPSPQQEAKATREQRERIEAGLTAYLERLQIPAAVSAAAKELGVPAVALREMYAAEYMLHFQRQHRGNALLDDMLREALADLGRHGAVGFGAVVANAQGNPQNSSHLDVLAKATWRPGYEADLLSWLAKQPAQTPLGAPLRMLGGIDTAASREALREGLKRYAESAQNFVAAATALGHLADSDAATHVEPKLYASTWAGARPDLLDALGRMGGQDASAILVEFLRHAEGDHESSALRALVRISPATARREARALLDGMGENKLDHHQTMLVKQFWKEL